MRGFRYFLVSICCFLLNVGFIAMAKLTLLVDPTHATLMMFRLSLVEAGAQSRTHFHTLQ